MESSLSGHSDNAAPLWIIGFGKTVTTGTEIYELFDVQPSSRRQYLSEQWSCFDFKSHIDFFEPASIVDG